MKKSLFILAVLGITFTTCEKDDSQPNNSPTNNGGNNPTGGTGGTGEVDSRDTITLRSYNVNYESIEKIVLIKAEYDDGALEDEYKLTISIDDIEEMYEDNEFGVEYSLGSPLNIISFWWMLVMFLKMVVLKLLNYQKAYIKSNIMWKYISKKHTPLVKMKILYLRCIIVK